MTSSIRIRVLSWITDDKDRTFAPGIHTVDEATAIYLRKTFEKLVETPKKDETAEEPELQVVPHQPSAEEAAYMAGVNTATPEPQVDIPGGDDSAL